MKDIKVLGIDLAKNVFQIHGTTKQGKCVLKKRVSREKLLESTANIPACTVGIEACTGSTYWAREFERQGHTVKIMSPQFVKPYVKSNKSDRNDAAAIAEAVTRPDMRFVPKKTIEQQNMLILHRARELVVKQQTALANQIRGLLAEYGVVIPIGIKQLKQLPIILDQNEEKIPMEPKEVFLRLHDQLKGCGVEVEYYERKIEAFAKKDSRCQAIMKIEGIGPITATALVGTIGDPSEFKRGREVSAWLGLVPKQHSSGNKVRLGGISKRGDKYVRKLLVHGARTVLKYCDKKSDRKSLWVKDKKERGGWNKAAVALANKHARVVWAILSTGEAYRGAISA